MKNSLLSASRIWHRRIGSLLFVFFLFVSLTGFMLGWKSLFSTTLYSAPAGRDRGGSSHWLALDSLQALAAGALTLHTEAKGDHPGKAEARLSAGYVEFQFKPDYYVRVEGRSGAITLIQRRYGGWIQDIHDGAIVDGWISDKGEVVKKIYSSALALALLFLTLSGFWLWYKPGRIRKARGSGVGKAAVVNTAESVGVFLGTLFVEALEDAALVEGFGGAGIGDPERVVVQARIDLATGDIVADGVAEKIVQQDLEELAVGRDRGLRKLGAAS
jgi:hypothetical protein